MAGVIFHRRTGITTVNAQRLIATTFLLLAVATGNVWTGSATAHAEDSVDTAADATVTLPTDFEGLLYALPDAELSERGAIILALAATRDERVLPILGALLDGRLQSSSDPTRLVLLADASDDPQAADALSGDALGASSALSLDRITLNNAMRGQLRDLLARLQLSSTVVRERMAAARRMIAAGATPESLALINEHLPNETDNDVRDALQTVLDLAALDSEDSAIRATAVTGLAHALYPEVHNRLTLIASDDADAAVRAAATKALRELDTRISRYRLLENVFFGLSMGSVLLLAAVGLAITFGVMGVINMAHGELMMLGAYTTWVLQQLMPNHLAASLLLSIPAAFLVAGIVGIAIERGVIRFLYGRPLETLLATFGISLILQQAVRSIFSPLNRSVSSPAFMSG
ncbi:MAG: hypothetical protein Q8J78_09955, partial [Moraxellaceae bacterium]|nr:hypothetical protein [Moraxellaceae bacterium]